MIVKVINKSAIKRLVKEKNMRLSKNALEKINDLIAEFTEGLVDESCEFANHAGRKTIKSEDIKLAIR